MKLENVIERFNTTPILFVGSGITRRYYDLPDWEGLLDHFAQIVKDDEFAYNFYKSKSQMTECKAGQLPKIAELIQQDYDLKWFSEPDTTVVKGKKANPFQLTKQQDEIVKLMMDNIKCNVDKKNYVISISVEDQDPLICATLADTVQAKLQDFITDYRTKKAKKDLEYYKKLSSDAKSKYERIRQQYGSYSDANQDVVLESYRLKANDMENEMQLLYNTYTTLQAQVQQAQAKLLMQTPAFTTLQSASVPLKPAGPKRMLFVLGMTVLVFLIISIYSTRKIIFGEME